jgi:DNA-binding cell septation regulator SpoVG
MENNPRPPFPDRFETELKICLRIIQSLDLGVTADGRFTQHGVVLHPNDLVVKVLRAYKENKGHFIGRPARSLVNYALARTHSAVLEALNIVPKQEGVGNE